MTSTLVADTKKTAFMTRAESGGIFSDAVEDITSYHTAIKVLPPDTIYLPPRRPSKTSKM